MKDTPKRISDITVCNGIISFECTSEMYGTTNAGGKAENTLKNGFVALGDGCDYVLNEEDKAEIKKQLRRDSYYTKEMNRLNPVNTINVQFSDGENHTKWLSLNPESIGAIEDFLNTYKLLLK